MSVAAYVGRRLLAALPLLWVVSVIAYVLLYRAADPVTRLRTIPGVRSEDLRRLIEQQGLDEPWYEGYWSWLSGFVRGDWGVSAVDRGADAFDVVMQALPATLELMGLALVLSALVAVALGVVSATRPGSARDRTIGALAYLGFATPTFLLGLLLQLGVIAMRDAGWGTVLYTGQRFSPDREGAVLSVDHLQHLVLPVLTLAVVNVAVWSRFQRAAMIEELGAGYVEAARARGLGERRVVLGHALRNALVPMVTLVALDLGAMFGGAVVTETVFSWPGVGRLLRDSAVDRDMNVTMGIVMLGAVAVVIAGLLADLVQAALDPRVDLARGRR